MSQPDFAQWTLHEASKRLESKELSSLELAKLCLARIAERDGEVGSFLHVDEKGALVSAQSADARRAQGKSLGVLDGIPVALKDMIMSEGLPTTAGSKILEGYVAPYDATVARKLKASGAVVLGKLNQDEFAMGSSNETSAYKLCKNPWNLACTPGGSSGGSAAAVAAGFVYATLGTDTGGSVRQPASFCGVTGIKPTYGRVSRHGIIAYASSLDQVGPLAKDVMGTAAMLEAISGHDERDSTSINQPVPGYVAALTGDVKGLKIGLPKEYFIDGLDDEVRRSVENAVACLKNRGAIVQEISLPQTSNAIATYYIIATAEASSNLSRYDGVRYGPRLGEEAGLRSMYEQTRGKLFGTEVKRRIMLGTYVLSAGYYDAYYLRAQKVRRLIADDFAKALEQVDVIVCPTTPTAAFRIGEKINDPLQMYLNDIFTISLNLAGLPGISLNSGFTATGMPIGTQMIGRAFDESTLMNAAFALEQELNLGKRWP